MSTRITAIVLLLFSSISLAESPTINSEIPDEFPRFIVPGHDAEMDALRALFYLHYRNNGPQATVWDDWLPNATLWPAGGKGSDTMRARWARALSSRYIDNEGYVSTQQHNGPAHAQGWPFPRWMEGGGAGWHFAALGVGPYEAPIVKPDEWTLTSARSGAIDAKGWHLVLTQPQATAGPPDISVKVPIHAPFLRLNWRAAGLAGAKPFVEWATKDQPEFSPDLRMYFPPADRAGEVRTMIPVYRHAQWTGIVTRLRLNFDNPPGASIVIKSFHTAFDSRHNVNNANFIRGCGEYFWWTGDVAFLRSQIARIRTAMDFAMREFDTRKRKCVYTPWIGHEGTSGVVRSPSGRKTIVRGAGIGNNYWDLLPFGGEDALATIYYYDAVNYLARLEEQIIAHPEWEIPASKIAYDPADLRRHASEVRDYSTKRFWNEKTGRFGSAVDASGALHDYGFTFLNTEAIYLSFPTDKQARLIMSWLDGRRIVEGDTATGPDIYHWRFAPRCTTRRNLDYYIWVWSAPESIPWGNQVQDGGGVLGWSYHDLMARIRVLGPDNAARRLREICTWFDEVQDAGGYRRYYEADPRRGTLQGGNVAGGLGLDMEFAESVLPPQVMLYGFLGVHPTEDGCDIHPNLPRDWPALTITQIRLHDHILDIKATHDSITITDLTPAAAPLKFRCPDTFTINP